MNKRIRDGISLGAAQSTVLDGVTVLPSEIVPIADALGRVVREDPVCDSDCPSGDVSAVDGYGFAGRRDAAACPDAAARLRVVGTVRAGAVPTMTVGDGECVEIMTGAPLPRGVDTVVAAEDIESVTGQVVVVSATPPGSRVARLGDFVRKGETLRLAGRRVTAQVLAVLAACGAPTAAVSRRPRVGVLATGDELVRCETVPGHGRVRASNVPMLGALASDTGCEVAETAICEDKADRIGQQIELWGGCDAVIMSGGASSGKYDLVRGALRAAGADIVFDEVRMRPGRRTIFARKKESLFFCLPGSPVGALVAFLMIARPGLLAMMGRSLAVPVPLRLRTTVRLDKVRDLAAGCPDGGAGPVASTDRRGRGCGPRQGGGYAWFVPARCVESDRGEGLWVEPVAGHGAGGAVVLAHTDCFIGMDERTHVAEAGQPVDVFMLQSDGSCGGEART